MLNKKITLILLINFLIFNACAQNVPSQEVIETYKAMENYHYKTDKRPSYGVEYSTTLKFTTGKYQE